MFFPDMMFALCVFVYVLIVSKEEGLTQRVTSFIAIVLCQVRLHTHTHCHKCVQTHTHIKLSTLHLQAVCTQRLFSFAFHFTY